MKNRKIGADVYWDSGEKIGRSIIFLDSDTEGQMKDGRPVKLIKGKWTYGVK